MAKDQLVYYHSKDCPTCEEVTPLITDLVNKHSVPLIMKEVEKCHDKGNGDPFCEKIEWVPTLAICTPSGKCKEIPLEKAVAKIKRMGKK